MSRKQEKKVKSSHIPTIVELLSEGAKDRPVPLTTVELAKKLGRSQQMASKHLDEMEREGLIERMRSRGMTYVKLTDKGIQSASELYSLLQSAFGKSERVIELSGQVFNGLGEGAYYVSMNGYRRQFLSKLGFDPYPGTLNLRLLSSAERKIRRDLAARRGIHIEGFEDGKRTYGGAECFKSLIDGKAQSAVLVVERTSYDDSVLEIIAPANLRKSLGLDEGSMVDVAIFVDDSEVT